MLCDRNAVAQVTAKLATTTLLCRYHYRRTLVDRVYYECIGYRFEKDPARFVGTCRACEIVVVDATLTHGTSQVSAALPSARAIIR